jgi:hypothetical protein
MKKIALSAVSAVALISTSAFAGVDDFQLETGIKYAGAKVFNPATGQMVRSTSASPASLARPASGAAEENFTAYDSIVDIPPISGFSRQTSVKPILGDEITLDIPSGLPTEAQTVFVTLFNSSATTSGAATTLNNGSLNVRFYDADTFAGYATSTPIGQFNGTFTNLNLAPGFFTFVGFDIEALDIVLPTTPIIITQQFDFGTVTGRSGSVLFDPINVGASEGYVYANAPTSNPSPTAEGFYNLRAAPLPSDFGYFIVLPEPTTLAAVAVASALGLRRRRA